MDGTNVSGETPKRRYVSGDHAVVSVGNSQLQLPAWAMLCDSDKTRSFSRDASSARLRSVMSYSTVKISFSSGAAVEVKMSGTTEPSFRRPRHSNSVQIGR